MQLGDIYYARLQSAYSEARTIGWKTFYTRIFRELQETNNSLWLILNRLGNNPNIFPEFQREVFMETIALLLFSLGPIREISEQDVSQIADELSADREDWRNLHDTAALARGIEVLERPEFVSLFHDLKNFVVQLVGDDEESFQALLCVFFLIMALAFPKSDKSSVAESPQEISPAIVDFVNSIPGIRW